MYNLEKTPVGYFLHLNGTQGSVQASVHRPESRPTWRLCFARCEGVARGLQGKVLDRATLGQIKEVITDCDRLFSSHEQLNAKSTEQFIAELIASESNQVTSPYPDKDTAEEGFDETAACVQSSGGGCA